MRRVFLYEAYVSVRSLRLKATSTIVRRRMETSAVSFVVVRMTRCILGGRRFPLMTPRFAMPQTHRVVLTDADRQWPLEFIGRGEASARAQTRARVLLKRVLLKADEGPRGPAWRDDRIAEALELSSGGVAGIRRRFSKRGLRGAPSSARRPTESTRRSSTASRRRG